MDTKAFIEAIGELAEAKSLTHEDIVNALQEALQRAYIRYLGGGDDARVKVEVDEQRGEIRLAQIKTVVDEVEDDYLEISVEDANKGLKKAKYKAGDDFEIPAPIDELSKVTALAVKSNLRQRLAEAERTALYRVYKDHIGEMMVGTVEKADDRGIVVNIGRTSVELNRRELIGDEYFAIGDQVKVYIQEVKSSQPVDGKPARGPQIEATRSSEGFLKRLFEEEIHEIFDGTVVIKAIARQAGVRSKVAVISHNEDIDATGACIGQGGSRIQKIVAQLGNAKNREKIDVVNYSDNIGLFIIEACRPATVLGVKIVDPEQKLAIAVINDESLPVAMGKYKSNANLACKITGYHIEFMEKHVAEETELDYIPSEVWVQQAAEEKLQKEREEYLRKSQEEAARREEAARQARAAAELAAKKAEEARLAEEAAKKAEEDRAKASSAKKVEPIIPQEAPRAGVKPEDFPQEATNPAAAALAAARAQDAARKAAEEAAEAERLAREAEEAAKPVMQEGPTEVQTTTTLSDLEKELESSKEKKGKTAAKSKRPRKITEEEVKRETVKPAVDAMPVYTEDELKEIEEEEASAYDLDVSEEDIDEDYSEYDKYYDDDDVR